ncbi:MAG: M23 family metallopeptidase [Dehalococcoidia bacterium]
MRLFIMAAFVLASFLVMSAAGAQEVSPIERGRTYTTWFYEGKTSEIWQRMSPQVQQLFGDEAGLQAFRDQVATMLGQEQAVVEEHVTRQLQIHTYTRVATFANSPEPFEVQWAFDDAGMIVVFGVQAAQEEAPSDYLDYETKTDLRLPFDGRWYVYWGGRSVYENYHAADAGQRFAYDLIIARDGVSHSGDGTQNEQYNCFGQAVLAPGDGVVSEAVDGVADNTPGEMNPEMLLGNHVIIDHENGEFSFLAHLQQGSVQVEPGERVDAGDDIGRCGNSGNSSEPHLHYHMQSTATIGEGAGLPAQFQSYVADGEPVERGEPRQNQYIEPS